MPVQNSTAERLVTVALELFATKGYRGTTVAEIEGAAGLTAGAGGLYRHFESKAAVLAAALDTVTLAVDDLEAVGRLLPLGDLRSELMLLGRAGLAGIQHNRRVLRVLERDGDLVPGLRARAALEVIGRGYEVTSRLVVQLFEAHGLPGPGDSLALAVLAIGSLANFAREQEFYGEFTTVDEQRLLETWVECWYAFATVDTARRSGRKARAHR